MRYIPLTKGFFAKVDDADFEMVAQFKWQAKISGNTVYAERTVTGLEGKNNTHSMHRFLLGVTDPKIQVDHIDHNGIDNQRANLRTCTRAQNAINRFKRSDNTSGYKGVSPTRIGKFIARHGKGGYRTTLGFFECPIEAARHYNRAAFENGEGFALLNDVSPLFPTTEYVKQLDRVSETKNE